MGSVLLTDVDEELYENEETLTNGTYYIHIEERDRESGHVLVMK